MNAGFRIWKKMITAAMGSASLLLIPAYAGGLQSASVSTSMIAETQPTSAEPQSEEGSVPEVNHSQVTFEVPVQSGISYRCRFHILVRAPRGKSSANVGGMQFSNPANQAHEEIFQPGAGSYLVATGPTEDGWKWVGCDPPG